MKPANALLSALGTTIFTQMSALAVRHGAINLGQGFPDTEGPADVVRAAADALLDQRNVAGIGNIWKAEGCWEAAIDPWRPVGAVTDAEARAIIERLRPRMRRSAETGRMADQPRVFRRPGQPCRRCGERILARGQGDDNRTTFWCPGCQR